MGHGKGKSASSSTVAPVVTIFRDYFNSYSDGNLAGQGSWAGDPGPQIQGDVTYEGTKAVKVLTGFQGIVEKEGLRIENGYCSFRLRKDADLAGVLNTHRLVIDSAPGKEIIHVEMNKNKLQYKVNGVFVHFLVPYVMGVWYRIEARWRGAPDYKVQYRFNDGAWGGWVTRATADSITGGYLIVLYSAFAVTGGIGYYDFIQ